MFEKLREGWKTLCKHKDRGKVVIRGKTTYYSGIPMHYFSFKISYVYGNGDGGRDVTLVGSSGGGCGAAASSLCGVEGLGPGPGGSITGPEQPARPLPATGE